MLLQTHLNQPPLGNRGHPRDDRDRTGFFLCYLSIFVGWLVFSLSLSLSLSFRFCFRFSRRGEAVTPIDGSPLGRPVFCFPFRCCVAHFHGRPRKRKRKKNPKKSETKRPRCRLHVAASRSRRSLALRDVIQIENWPIVGPSSCFFLGVRVDQGQRPPPRWLSTTSFYH